VSLALIGTLAIVVLLRKGAITQQNGQFSKTEQAHSGLLLSELEGLRTAKTYGLEHQLARRGEALYEQRVVAAKAIDDINLGLQSLAATFAQLSTVGVVAMGALRVTDGGLAACTILVGRATRPCRGALGLWTRLQHLADVKERPADLF
jgi:ATP-binding cassette, subfamily C, bacterial LapB